MTTSANRPWDDAAIARLTELWPTTSTAQIATMLVHEFKRDFSRNSVIGKAHRIGLAGKPSPLGGGRKQHYAKAITNRRSVSTTALRATEKRAREAKAPAAPIAPQPIVERDGTLPRVSLEHVQDTDGCRFPIGTPRTPSFGFCGAEREHADPHNPISFFAGGTPYCAFHRHKTSVKTVRQIGEQSSPSRRAGGMGRS